MWLIIFPSEDRRRSPSPHHPAGRMPSGTRAEIPYSQHHPSPTIVRPVALVERINFGSKLLHCPGDLKERRSDRLNRWVEAVRLSQCPLNAPLKAAGSHGHGAHANPQRGSPNGCTVPVDR